MLYLPIIALLIIALTLSGCVMSLTCISHIDSDRNGKCDHCGIQRFQNVILQPFQHSHTSTVTGKDAESPSVTAMMRASPGAIARMVYRSPVWPRLDT